MLTLITLALSTPAFAWDVPYSKNGEPARVVWCKPNDHFDVNAVEVEDWSQDQILDAAIGAASTWEAVAEVPVFYERNFDGELAPASGDGINSIVFTTEESGLFEDNEAYYVDFQERKNVLGKPCYDEFDLVLNLENKMVQEDLEPVFLEAWGYTYGLEYSGREGAVMEEGLEGQPDHLSEDDVSGILFLYGSRHGCNSIATGPPGWLAIGLVPIIFRRRRD